MSTPAIILATLIAYKVGLLGVGVWASRRVGTEADFFIASGRLGAWTAGLSYAASTSSAWVLLGFTGLVFAQGPVGLWLLPGIFGGYVMTWLVMGPWLNAQARQHDDITVIDILRRGTGRWSRSIGVVAAVLILFGFTVYISSQFQAAGNALSEVFGLGVAESVLIGAVVILIYCTLGGFWAASMTDALQAGVMVAACVLVPAAVIGAGGLAAIRAGWTGGGDIAAPTMAGLGVGLGLLGTGLGALGQPQLLNRIMAVRSPRDRLRGFAVTAAWGVVIYTGLTGLALAARGLGVETQGEALFFAAAAQYLPAVLAGIVTAAVLSAVMSTTDSLLLAAASAVSHDLGFRWGGRELIAGRIAMVGVGVLSVILTLALPASIFSRVLFSWVALGAAFGPSLLVGALGVKVRGWAVLVAVIAGFAVAVTASTQSGELAKLVEVFGSWAVGLAVLMAGRDRPVPARTGTVASVAR